MKFACETLCAVVLASLLLISNVSAAQNITWSLRLPDTTGIRGELTENLSIDGFFSLWLVFQNDDVKTAAGEEFTILAPVNSSLAEVKPIMNHPNLLRRLLMRHIVLGHRFEFPTSASPDEPQTVNLTTLAGNTVIVRKFNESVVTVDGVPVIGSKVDVPNGSIVVLERFLIPTEPARRTIATEEPATTPKSPLQEELDDESNETGTHVLDDVSELTFITSNDAGEDFMSKQDNFTSSEGNLTFLGNVERVLGLLKGGAFNFRRFLSRSNVSHLFKDDEEYTVLVPMDDAFQRWHPIDWGFYPFSVDEFTNRILLNHFVRGNLRQDQLKNGLTALTLGGWTVTFSVSPLTVNSVPIIRGDTPVGGGNIMFITQVLFVNAEVVKRLNEEHRDKETPPLLAYPWYKAQFLSHAYLDLNKREDFSYMAQYINMSDLASHVPGAGYTFFVPNDYAFLISMLQDAPDPYYVNKSFRERVLLSHLVAGRLYADDLTDGRNLTTLGNTTIVVKRDGDNINVNDAKVVESNIFVYNLGNMFFIDRVLFVTPTDVVEAIEDYPFSPFFEEETTDDPEVEVMATEHGEFATAEENTEEREETTELPEDNTTLSNPDSTDDTTGTTTTLSDDVTTDASITLDGETADEATEENITNIMNEFENTTTVLLQDHTEADQSTETELDTTTSTSETEQNVTTVLSSST